MKKRLKKPGNPTAVLTALCVLLAAVSAFLYIGYFRSNVRISSSVSVPFNTHHVQGLEVTGRYYYISSVDISAKRGWLYKVDRSSMKLLAARDITEKKMYHPGGIHYDGTYLWVCLAEYKADSKARIIAFDPETLSPQRSFIVKDHVSFIVSNGKDRLYGSSWASKMLYEFDWDGNILRKPVNPRDRDYQDGTFIGGRLVIGCKTTGRMDIIDPATFEVIGRLLTPRISPKDYMTREGLSVFGDQIFLMPEDGPNTRIFICRTNRKRVLFGE
ncbi:MAG: DUF6454 family protein [Spirochaetota bacterium]